MEYLDVVTENNELTGRKEERNFIHENGIWHREVAVWIMNEKGEILLQKRAKTKKQYPDKWSICAGDIDASESVEVAMVREIEEEIGISLKIEDLEFLGVYKVQEETNNIKNNYFNYTYFIKRDWKIEDYKIRLEELSEVKYFSFEKIEEMIRNGSEDITFVEKSYMPEILELLRNRL